jgi:hypothetical protein
MRLAHPNHSPSAWCSLRAPSSSRVSRHWPRHVRIQLNLATPLGGNQVGEAATATVRAAGGMDDASIRAGLVWCVRFVDHG